MKISKKKKQDSFIEALHKHLNGLTEEEKDSLRKQLSARQDSIPKGWVSIEDHLPGFLAEDLLQGYSLYKVKDVDGNEFESGVTDHNIWYYRVKEQGITHWYNE